MRSLTRWSAVLALALTAGACASHPPAPAGATDASARRPRPNRRTDLITMEEMERKHWTNVYEMVSELHANWLHDRGPNSILGSPGQIQVQLDDVRLGDVSSLRDLQVSNISYVQYFDPVSAFARWGLGYNYGAILVATRR